MMSNNAYIAIVIVVFLIFLSSIGTCSTATYKEKPSINCTSDTSYRNLMLDKVGKL